MGTTFAISVSLEKSSCQSLKINVIELEISLLINFKTSKDIPSCPLLFDSFKHFLSFVSYQCYRSNEM